MIKTISNHGALKTVSWHAEMPLITKPKIRKQFKMIDGVKFYLGLRNDKEYRADLFDKYWTEGSATI